MESLEIPFNYFYKIFNDENRKAYFELKQKRISETSEDLDNIFDSLLLKEEMLSIYNKTLYNICTNYVSISNSSIDIFSKDTLEFVDLILDTMHDNPYKESFLTSLQFIYQNYFDCLGKGCPILMSSENNEIESSFLVTLDSHNEITQFEAINMEFIEQDKTMTKLLTMEINKQQGPLPKVLYYIRKDI